MSDLLGFARYDWLVTNRGERLHAIHPDHHDAADDAEWAFVSARFACGRRFSRAFIPGLFTRMGATRCAACCRATGMPPGRGSPKNDDACDAALRGQA